MTSDALLAGLLAAAVVVGVPWWSAVLVGRVAEEFHEEPARWQAMMLPFGLLGPLIARMLLVRRGGGGGGFA